MPNAMTNRANRNRANRNRAAAIAAAHERILQGFRIAQAGGEDGPPAPPPPPPPPPPPSTPGWRTLAPVGVPEGGWGGGAIEYGPGYQPMPQVSAQTFQRTFTPAPFFPTPGAPQISRPQKPNFTPSKGIPLQRTPGSTSIPGYQQGWQGQSTNPWLSRAAVAYKAPKVPAAPRWTGGSLPIGQPYQGGVLGQRTQTSPWPARPTNAMMEY